MDPKEKYKNRKNLMEDSEESDEDDKDDFLEALEKLDPSQAEELEVVPKKEEVSLANGLRMEDDSQNVYQPKMEMEKMEGQKIVKIVYNNTDLWVDKYAPEKSSEILGNGKTIQTIRSWLRKWESTHLFKKPSFGKKNRIKVEGWRNVDHSKKSILISGKPGIGKTSCAKLVCRENNFEVIELNASDARSKKAIEKISHLMTNRTITQYFKRANQVESKDAVIKQIETSFKKRKKLCIVMDEVDGMTGDKGGISELLSRIRTSKVPIMCICNDRNSMKIKPLVAKCLDAKFFPPQASQIISRMQEICTMEKFQIRKEDVQSIVHSLRGDIRSIINYLQFLSKLPDNLKGDMLSKKNIKEADRNRLIAPKKDLQNSNIFGITKTIFEKKGTLNDKIRSYFMNKDMIPLFIQQNYINIFPTRLAQARISNVEKDKARMRLISESANSISYGDCVMSKILTTQNYKLLPDHAIYSTCVPSQRLNGYYSSVMGYDYNVQFPVSLGNGSKERKNFNTLKEIYHSSSGTISGQINDIILDYIPMMKHSTIVQLMEGEERIGRAIDAMSIYGINRQNIEEVDKFAGLGKSKDWKKIPKGVKTKFTMQLKKKMAKVTEVSKRKSNRKTFYSSDSDMSDVDEGNFGLFQRRVSVDIKGGTFTAKETNEKKRKRKSNKKPRKRRKF